MVKTPAIGRTEKRLEKADKEYGKIYRRREMGYHYSNMKPPEEDFQKARAKYRKYDRKVFMAGTGAPFEDQANQLRRDMRRADKIIKKHKGWLDGTVKNPAMDRKVMKEASALFAKHVIVSEGGRGAGGGGPISKDEYEAIIKSVDAKHKKDKK
jgi:hypothetical protein